MFNTLRNKIRKQEVAMSHHTETGTVKWFGEKGFGFIIRDNGAPDVFAHWQNINGEGYKVLVEGQRVEFEVEDTDKGPAAKNITVV